MGGDSLGGGACIALFCMCPNRWVSAALLDKLFSNTYGNAAPERVGGVNGLTLSYLSKVVYDLVTLASSI